MANTCEHGGLRRSCETCAAWASAEHNTERARKAEAEVERLNGQHSRAAVVLSAVVPGCDERNDIETNATATLAHLLALEEEYEQLDRSRRKVQRAAREALADFTTRPRWVVYRRENCGRRNVVGFRRACVDCFRALPPDGVCKRCE